MTSKMSPKFGVLLLVAILIGGCSITGVLTLNGSDTQGIKLYFTKAPDKGYDELEYIVTDGLNLNNEKLQFIQAAQKVNANAVINMQVYFAHGEYVISGLAVHLHND